MIYRETQLNLCSNSSTQAKDLWDLLLKAINQKNTPTIAHCVVMWWCMDCFCYCLLLDIIICYLPILS